MWFADQAIRLVAMILSVNRSICCHACLLEHCKQHLEHAWFEPDYLNMFLSDSFLFFLFFFSIRAAMFDSKTMWYLCRTKKVQIMFSVRYKSLIWIGFFKAWFPVALFLFLLFFYPLLFLINRKIERHLFFVCCCFSNCCFCISVFVIVHRLLAAAAIKCFLSKSTSFVQKFIDGRPGGSILNLQCPPRVLI